MRAELRYRLVLAARSRAVLAAAAAWLFVLVGVYAYHPNEVRGSYAVTALLLCPLTAWMTVALSHAEPAPQRELLAAAAGIEPVGALVRAALAATVLGLGAGTVDLAYPLATRAFDRSATASDLAVAALAHAGCAGYGAALGTLTGACLIARPALAFAVLAALAVAVVPLFELAAPLSPAAWTADALLDDGGSVVLPALALALHAAAVVALAGAALRRIP